MDGTSVCLVWSYHVPVGRFAHNQKGSSTLEIKKKKHKIAKYCRT